MTKKWNLLWLIFWAVCFHSDVWSQTDDVFWFAVPEVTESHNDRPIQLRLNTLDDPAQVRISMPANASFSPITISIPPLSLERVDLTPFIDQLENRPASEILEKGLLIEASTCISAYYEVSAWNNTDIFVLKGSNALGNRFMIPFQDRWGHDQFDPRATSGFDIVATRNNTHVIITPTADAIGHEANIPFEVILNRGQTYSVIAANAPRTEKLIGTMVNSDQPIAITVKDDSQLNTDGGTCADIGGDQLVPLDRIGTNYIIPRGRLNTADIVTILATENGTEIFVDGNVNPDFILNRGEQARITLSTEVMSLRSTHPVYVLHASGVNCEVGHAIVPHLQCTGSKEVSTSRVDNGPLFLFIIVPTGAEDAFTVSGIDFMINPNMFSSVPGNPAYRVARISANSIPLDTPFRVSNEEAGFHLGILNGNTGARYGYFSDFGSLQVTVSETIICQGDFVDISVKSTYSELEWIPDIMNSNLNFSLAPMETTRYQLIASDTDMCRDTAQFTIRVNTSPENFDTIIACSNDNIRVGNQQITESGDYALHLLAGTGCDSSIFYNITFLDTLQSYDEMILCPGERITLFDGVEVSEAGFYSQVYASRSGCDSIHTIEVISDNTLVNEDTVFLCSGSTINLFDEVISETGVYSRTVSSSRSCDSLQIYHVLPALPFDLLDTVTICLGTTINLLDQNIQEGGLYSETYTSRQGCDSTHTYRVLIDDPNEYINEPTDQQMVFGDTLKWIFTDQTGWIDTLIWNTLLGLSCKDCAIWEFHPFATTAYTVQVWTAGGCMLEYDFLIEVKDEKPVFFPNTFSPNGDGLNDLFNGYTPENGALIDQLDIYDRWGNLHARLEQLILNNPGVGWDGRTDAGTLLSPGVYVYQATISFVEGKSFVYTGDVTLVR